MFRSNHKVRYVEKKHRFLLRAVWMFTHVLNFTLLRLFVFYFFVMKSSAEVISSSISASSGVANVQCAPQ